MRNKTVSPRVVRIALVATLISVIIVGTAPIYLGRFIITILIHALFLGALTLTVDLLWGYIGILTFGQSAFFGIGAYACALTFTHYGFGVGWAIGALLVGILGAVLVAALIGLVAFYHGASPLYASIVTLALPIVVVQLVLAGGPYTGSSSGLSSFPTYYWANAIWFWIAGGYLILVTLVTWLFIKSDFGRVLIAIRENEERCAYLGIPVSRIKILLMVTAAAIGAIAGFGYAAYSDVVASELAGFILGTKLLMWTALGGRATLVGPVLGAIGIHVTSSYLSGSLPFFWKLFVGVTFVVVIVVLPKGFAPLFLFLPRYIKARRGASATKQSSDSVIRLRSVSTASVLKDTGARLVTEGLSRQYGSLRVLRNIKLKGNGGELIGIVGPNGAGKTTLMRCISDGKERSEGRVLIKGNDIRRRPPHVVAAFGVGRSFQNTNLFDTLTVGDCLMLSRYRIRRPPVLSRQTEIGLPKPALDVLEAIGLDKELATETRFLSHGMKRGLELAMVLGPEPSVLLLDEPTAGLTKSERNVIGNVLQKLTEEYGLCVLLIEHDLDFVQDVSSRIVVLHQGELLLEGSVEEVISSELVQSVYAGHEVGGAA